MNYNTVSGVAETSFIEKNSEFVGYISPIESLCDADEFIKHIRGKHHKASHNVYAYMLRDGAVSISRYSDDGEPSGTAGIPILDVIRKRNLTNVCIVVSRYFGGVLLGGGGLVRAYSHSASITCDAASVVNMCQCRRISLKTEYSLYGKISYILPEYNVITESSLFTENVMLEILVKSDIVDRLVTELTELSCGKLEFTVEEELFADFN